MILSWICVGLGFFVILCQFILGIMWRIKVEPTAGHRSHVRYHLLMLRGDAGVIGFFVIAAVWKYLWTI